MVDPKKCICGGELQITESPYTNTWFHGQCTKCPHHQQASTKEGVIKMWNWFIGIAEKDKMTVDRFKTLARLWNDR